MSQVLQLRSERAKLNEELQQIAKIESGGESLTAEQLSRFTELEAQITQLTDKITRAESAERIAAAAAVPVNETAQGLSSFVAGRVEGPYDTKTDPALGAAQMIRLMVQADRNQHRAAELAKAGGFGSDVYMALSTTTPSAGGVLIPENFSSALIESLRPASVMRRMGVQTMPFDNGNQTIPRVRGNTVVTYGNDDDAIAVTGMEFDDLKLTAKRASALVPVANSLMRRAGVSPKVDALVNNDLTTSMGLSQDLYFIRGSGEGHTPKGMRYWALPANLVAQPSDVTLTAVDKYLGSLMLRIETANVNMAGCGWLLHPRALRWLQSLRDGNGNKAYPEIELGKLKGYPFALTTQIPVNLGENGNESEIYFADFADCFIAEEEELLFSISTDATYKDSEGNIISAFQYDQTLIRVISTHDFGPRHVESIAVGTGITWGVGM